MQSTKCEMIFHQLKVADGEEKMNSKCYIFTLNFFVLEKKFLNNEIHFSMSRAFRENDL